MQFFSLALFAISAVSAQSSFGTVTNGSVSPVTPKPTPAPAAPVAGNNGTAPKSNGTMICGTTTITLNGSVTTVTATTYTNLAPDATTVLVIPAPVTVGTTTTTINVVVPILSGAPLSSGVVTPTYVPSGTGGNKQPLPTSGPTPDGSDATKVMGGSVAAVVAAIALFA